MTYKAKELDLRLPLLESLMPSNAEHVDRAVEWCWIRVKRKLRNLG